jgi:hypothetical protein
MACEENITAASVNDDIDMNWTAKRLTSKADGHIEDG